MKLLGVLISFALVGNVLVTELDDYLQLVIETNVAISQAKKFMPAVIKYMISHSEEFGMQEMAFMLSTPDRIDFKLFNPEDPVLLPVREEINVPPVVEKPVEYRIPFVNLVPGEGSIQLFGTYLHPDPNPVINLDAEEDLNPNQIPVINLDAEEDMNLDPSTVPEEELKQDQIPVINLDPGEGPSQRQIPDLNLDPSTVPEEDSKSENPNIVGITIIDFEEKFQFQKMMRLAILAVTNRREYERIVASARTVRTVPVPVPIYKLDLNLPPIQDTGRIEVPAIKLENISSVLEKRRMDPSAVTNKRLIRALGLDYLAKARREMTLEAITTLIRQNDPFFQSLYMMGRLVGAFRSIKYPNSFIISVDIMEDDRVGLIDSTDENGYVYEFRGSEFCQVDKYSFVRINSFLSELE